MSIYQRMSNLRAEKRMNSKGHMVTKHVRDDAADQTQSAVKIPPPAVAEVETPIKRYQATIRDVLSEHMPQEEAEAYADYVGRRPEQAVKLLADVLSEAETEDEISMVRCMLKDHAHNPRLMQLTLDDPKFVMALEEPLRGNRLHSHETKYSRALSAVEEAFTPAFRNRAAEVPMDFDYKKYGPVFRASVVTKMLHLNESAPTTFDEYEQLQQVRENMDLIMKHLKVCKHSADIMSQHNMVPTSADMLEICDLLEEYPNSGDTVVGYLSERKRFHMDELYDMVSNGASALSEGVL